MQGLVQTFHLLPLLLLTTGRAVALGGKSFFTSQRSDLIHKNYAMLTMCQPQEKVYLNVSLYLNPLQENHHIKFVRADMPFEVSRSTCRCCTFLARSTLRPRKLPPDSGV
ncbi:unnamed protein product [Heligmosomoides polygyrus]|uniref:Secreted protein n=1 Tax=Heligmosomoides polygyrus TaxID=6339 RepID=A0A183GPW7_HELPZ|nr:unnamed protein product [Heligmosomoides polygyrus]